MSLLALRINTTILLALVLCVMAYALQVSAQALPGIGSVNHLAVDVIKVTTNPTDPKDTADINGPVGGDSVSIYVKVQYGNVITSINSVTVNIHESGVSTIVGTLSLTTYTQLADSGSGDATLHTRVYTGTWNTLTTTPLIYNSEYCFNATVDYDRNNAHASPAVDSGEVKVPVKNLVIQTVSPEDFTVVTVGQSTPVDFIVALADYGTTFSYTLTLTIRRTAANTTTIRTLTQSGTGLQHTISWDLKDKDGQSVNGVGGYFTYDLTVSKAITGGTDTQQYRSTHISVEQDDVYLAIDSEGNIIRNIYNQAHALFKYYLSEQPTMDSVTVYFYQDTVQKGVVSSLDEQDRWNPPSAPVDCWVSLGDNLSIRGIICAKDNRASEYRKRQPRHMLVKNQGRANYWHRCALTFNLVGADNGHGYLQEWAKFWNIATMTMAKDWHVENSWPGNTSSGDRMNADDHDLEWENGGPLPESSPGDNTVYENGTNLRWHIKDGGDGEIIENSSVQTGFTWCNADGSPKNFGGANPYREWRYYILNDKTNGHGWGQPGDNEESSCNGDDYHHSITDPPTDGEYDKHHCRCWFRIHEDGNYNNSKGSAGCIALLPGEMEQFWNRVHQIWGAFTAMSDDAWLPLMVYDRNGCGGILTEMHSWVTSTVCDHEG